MNEKGIKSAFISGKMVCIDGKWGTQMYTKEEIQAIKNSPKHTKEELEAMDKRIDQYMREMSPDFHKKLYPQQYEN